MHAIFAAHPTVGHTQALRAIGKTLLARGHSVEFAMAPSPPLPSWAPIPEALRASRTLSAALVKDGFALVAVNPSLRALYHGVRTSQTQGYDELEHAVTMFTLDALGAARALVRVGRESRPAVVVADFAYPGAQLAAEVLDVPFVAVFHSGLPFEAPGAPPFGSGLAADAPAAEREEARSRLARIERGAMERMSRARRSLGLAPEGRSVLVAPYSRALNVLTTFEQLELPRPDLAQRASGPLLWSGPCIGDRSSAAPDFDWSRFDPSARWVYVSLGTVFNNQPEVYRKLVAAVHRAGARAVIAAGASLDALRRVVGRDDIVVRFAPQVELVSKVRAMIGHGGNNSTNEALVAGCPLVIVPFGAEQIANGQRVEHLGAGAMVRAHELTDAKLDRALSIALSDSTRQNARSLADSLPTGDGAPRVADAIERLVAR
jgi:MGT family glycosyltransferase